jgi:hypothetical protein
MWGQIKITDPTPEVSVLRGEPHILAVAGRLIHTARRRFLHIDPAWPWAHEITTAHTRLATLTP